MPGSGGQDVPANIGPGIQYQETSQWVWIAVAASVAHFYQPSSSATQSAMMTTIGRTIDQWPATVDCSPTAAVLAAHPGLAATLAHPYGTAAEFALESEGIPGMCLRSGGVGDAPHVNGESVISFGTFPEQYFSGAMLDGYTFTTPG